MTKALFQVWTKNGFGDTVLIKTYKARKTAQAHIERSYPGSGYIVQISA